MMTEFCLFRVVAFHPSQQFLGHVGTNSRLPGLIQYLAEDKVFFAQGHNTGPPVSLKAATLPC